MLKVIAAIGALLSMSSMSPAGWNSPPPPDKIVIDVATVNGSGCPANTAAVAVSADNTSFTVTYNSFMAKAGKGAGPTDFIKNCQLNLRVHVPQGFTYAIAEADYRGYAHLEPGATGQEKANYYFQGMPQTASVSHALATPLDDDWQETDSTDVAALVYKPCGEERNFNINAELKVGLGTSDPQKTSFVAMFSTDGGITTTYHFAWKTC